MLNVFVSYKYLNKRKIEHKESNKRNFRPKEGERFNKPQNKHYDFFRCLKSLVFNGQNYFDDMVNTVISILNYF